MSKCEHTASSLVPLAKVSAPFSRRHWLARGKSSAPFRLRHWLPPRIGSRPSWPGLEPCGLEAAGKRRSGRCPAAPSQRSANPPGDLEVFVASVSHGGANEFHNPKKKRESSMKKINKRENKKDESSASSRPLGQVCVPLQLMFRF